MSLGRDGLVYLSCGAPHVGNVVRLAPDGTELRSGTVGYAVTSIAANAAGDIATAETHLSQWVDVWDKEFTPLGRIGDFLANDTTRFFAPSDVTAGASGDFYAVDQFRSRVVRISTRPAVTRTALHPLALPEMAVDGTEVSLRVCEALSLFVVAWAKGGIRVCSFDGTVRWSLAEVVPTGRFASAFDVTDSGDLYVHAKGTDGLTVYSLSQQRQTRFRRFVGGADAEITDLRVLDDDRILVHREDPQTLFEVYRRGLHKPSPTPPEPTAVLDHAVPADVERLTVETPSEIWTAGVSVPLTLTHDAGRWPSRPRLRAWWRPLGVPEYTELPLVDGHVTPPADARGLYHLRVGTDVRGRFAEYDVNGVIEVHTKDATGTVSILTPLNRFYYGIGEPIPVTVIARTTTPITQVTVELRKAGQIISSATVTLQNGRRTTTFTDTGRLAPGRYVLDAQVAGVTVAPQYLEVGPGPVGADPFRIVQHGDYGDCFPVDPRHPDKPYPVLPVDVPELCADLLARAGRLGLNFFLDRLSFLWRSRFANTSADSGTTKRLHDTPLTVAEEKSVFEDHHRRSIAGFGAYGIREQPILLYMDTHLPLSPEKKTEVLDDLTGVSKILKEYPAFRGWSWAANWWLDTGAKAAANPAEAKAYTDALAKATTTREWPAVLDTVSGRILALRIAAEEDFRTALDAVVPGKVSVMSGAYRAVGVHPPLTYAQADEVDLHFQCEQIQPPQTSAHNVDFGKRPGKPAFGHPELWNDDGTGGMLLPMLFQMAMRGADGVGSSGDVSTQSGPQGGRADLSTTTHRTNGPDPSDARCAGPGKLSAARAAYAAIARYGKRLAAAQKADPVAIVVSTRMNRIDDWTMYTFCGEYFGRLLEAYNACLYAHRPASFVFTEDLTPGVFDRFSAILVVGQRVALEPQLAQALRASGRPVYFDGTCRSELLDGFTPLGFSFNQVNSERFPHQDDAAYERFRRYFIDDAAKLSALWGTPGPAGTFVPPVAECDNPEVLLSARQAGTVRYVWAVNNTMPDWGPGIAWRLSLLLAHRIPVLASLKLTIPAGHTVLDVYSGKTVTPVDGRITADLRTAPARLYAIGPAADLPVPAPGETPVQDLFGPRVRDMAISERGDTAVLNVFGWDHNLYGVDLATGETGWRAKLGHFFAFAPAWQPDGFSAQGYDVSTASGYHLYLLDGQGRPERRFATYGLPKRATDWASANLIKDTAINSFAVSRDRTWVAACGDLGLVVWDRDGTRRWTRDTWREGRREPKRLLSPDSNTLVAFGGRRVTEYSADQGVVRWEITITDTGSLLGGVTVGDGETMVLWSDTLGGRVFVIRAGQVINTIATRAEELAVSADGRLIVVTQGRQLRAFDAASGLLWSYTGDDALRRPCIDPGAGFGPRIAVGSELGTLTVLSSTGEILLERDLGALPVPKWLPGGDLLVATWMGRVMRLDAAYAPKWQKILAPTETDARSKLLAPDPTPTTRWRGWGKTTTPPGELSPNLLADTTALTTVVYGAGLQAELRHAGEELYDGETAAPDGPWFDWYYIGAAESRDIKGLYLHIDAFRSWLSVEGVTFVEDPAHPESWLRDVRLQYWDPAAKTWRDGPLLLSDTAPHTHRFPAIEGRRFRLATTGGYGWPSGNIRLSELVFHGRHLGNSHPDVRANNKLAILFDEDEDALRPMIRSGTPFGYRYGGVYPDSVLCVEMAFAGTSFPAFTKEFGYGLPDWDFRVVENPAAPGEYRWLQFAWKALANCTGMSLRMSSATAALAVTAGAVTWEGATAAEHKVTTPPTEWSFVRVDLWALMNGKEPPALQIMGLKTVGGGALFDQIVLGRAEADLPKPPTG